MKIKDHDFYVLLLGVIAGVSLCIIIYQFIILPDVIKEIEQRAEQQAMTAKIAEYYTNLYNQIKFRFLTEEKE